MTTETIIPVNLETGYIHEEGNELAEARQRIEKTALYMESIFNLINLSARYLESCGETNLDDYLSDLQHVAEIGKAVAASVFESIMPYSSVEIDIKESGRVINNAPDILDLSSFSCEGLNTNDLANHLSAVLKAPDLPPVIHEALMMSINDVFNSEIDQKEFVEYENSPEYLERLLKGYKRKHGGD